MASFLYVSFCLVYLIVFHCHCNFALPQESLDASIIRLPYFKGQHDPATRDDDGGLQTNTQVKPREKLVCEYLDQRLSCPVNCFRPDPVCGVDGVTYWCGCKDAKCANVDVAHLGFCSLPHSAGSGGLGLLSGQALLLIHTVWLVLIALSIIIGLA